MRKFGVLTLPIYTIEIDVFFSHDCMQWPLGELDYWTRTSLPNYTGCDSSVFCNHSDQWKCSIQASEIHYSWAQWRRTEASVLMCTCSPRICINIVAPSSILSTPEKLEFRSFSLFRGFSLCGLSVVMCKHRIFSLDSIVKNPSSPGDDVNPIVSLKAHDGPVYNVSQLCLGMYLLACVLCYLSCKGTNQNDWLASDCGEDYDILILSCGFDGYVCGWSWNEILCSASAQTRAEEPQLRPKFCVRVPNADKSEGEMAVNAVGVDEVHQRFFAGWFHVLDPFVICFATSELWYHRHVSLIIVFGSWAILREPIVSSKWSQILKEGEHVNES